MRLALNVSLACVLATALVAPPAAGQQPPAGQGENAPNRIVVIADVSADETENARLRASLYEDARGRGYEPAVGLDAVRTAEKQGFVRGGSVTTDEGELDSLRRALGVGYLVRVSKDSTGSVRVTMVSDRGPTSRQAPPNAVEPAVGELLGRAPGAAAASGTSAATTSASASTGSAGTTATMGASSEGGIVAGGLVLTDQPGKPESDREIREAWNARGGARLTYGVRGLVTAQRIEDVTVRDQRRPGGPVVTGTANADGIGGGVGVQVGLMYLPLPEDPKLSQGVIPAIRLGIGADTNFLWVRRPAGFQWDSDGNREVTYEDQALWIVNLMPHVGFHLGFGNYQDLNTWRGALVGISWQPAEQYQLDMAKEPGDGEFRFNWAGFELSADLTTIKTEEPAQTQIRFALYALFPIDQDHPGLLSASIGAFWY